MTTLFDDPRVAELLGPGLVNVVASVFRQMEIAEDEIAVARGGRTDVDEADLLWRAFPLLRGTDELMGTEIVYRAHCRELLARVAAGDDTRPATDAEIVSAIVRASQEVPVHGSIVGLQARLFARMFPDEAARIDLDLDALERVYGDDVDRWENELRRKGRQDWRRLDKKETS